VVFRITWFGRYNTVFCYFGWVLGRFLCGLLCVLVFLCILGWLGCCNTQFGCFGVCYILCGYCVFEGLEICELCGTLRVLDLCVLVVLFAVSCIWVDCCICVLLCLVGIIQMFAVLWVSDAFAVDGMG